MDLRTRYLGLELAHPIVPSASPLAASLDGIRRLEEAGAAAIVLPSLFEEQINAESYQLDHYLSFGADSHPEALSYFPDLGSYQVGPEQYLKLVSRAKDVVGVPVIASLNGVSAGGWLEYARAIEQAGADALELNVYYLPTDPRLSSAEVEAMYVEDVRTVKESVSIPLALKVGPFFSAFANLAQRFAEAGANGLVLFNRFYQPDFDLESLAVVPRLVLSDSDDLRLPLNWVAILYDRVAVDFAITSGIHTTEDALKGLMAGANVTMMASELMRHGLGRLAEVRDGISEWLEAREYDSVRQMIGSMSQQNVAEPSAFERAHYISTVGAFRVD
jgi:dihydroorotate dehydrogenase (fumarate)